MLACLFSSSFYFFSLPSFSVFKWIAIGSKMAVHLIAGFGNPREVCFPFPRFSPYLGFLPVYHFIPHCTKNIVLSPALCVYSYLYLEIIIYKCIKNSLVISFLIFIFYLFSLVHVLIYFMSWKRVKYMYKYIILVYLWLVGVRQYVWTGALDAKSANSVILPVSTPFCEIYLHFLRKYKYFYCKKTRKQCLCSHFIKFKKVKAFCEVNCNCTENTPPPLRWNIYLSSCFFPFFFFYKGR